MLATSALIPVSVTASSKGSVAHHGQVSDHMISQQRSHLAKNAKGKGFGPQSPRDIDASAGSNSRAFNASPASTAMNLCNIHFHKNAEQ